MKRSLIILLAVALMAGIANAANVAVNANISGSTTWTADNVYNLVGQIYVLPGATLNIEAGTLIQSIPADQGSLAVCRGAKIYANGTKSSPIIMTSTNDNLSSWHEGCNEWGNLTIMGNGLISASHYGGVAVVVNGRTNTKDPNALNQKTMEGLTAGFVGDTKVLYGGGDDDDDSGSVTYVSLRYGGKVIGLANELNGLSLGAIGRETDIHHIEIMNNVDDGIEIWGGTVNLSYISIWNIGDDSLDIDEGYRGKIQFGLIVQGYAINASQGSGVGDNCFEIDGAEDSDAQPCTTTTIYNFTTVGQPIDGDHGTAWRDNAHVQYRNCIWMDLGEKLVQNDNVDGDGANGYGYNGTVSWVNCWTTSYAYSLAGTLPNRGIWTAGAFNDPSVMYQAQTSGNLCEIRDSVFYNNLFATAYTEADARGVRTAYNNNVTAASSPIQSLTRGAAVVRGGKTMVPVTYINPRPANDALVSVAAAPSDGFFKPAHFRGGFSATNNWLGGWTAASDYGMTDALMGTEDNYNAKGDLNEDGSIGLTDFAIFSEGWLTTL
jgi:hypothetical protein